MVHQTPLRRASHREALLLAWNSLHVPFGTLLLGGIVLLAVVSAVSSILAVSPVNGIP
jgi:hypothetical protein